MGKKNSEELNKLRDINGIGEKTIADLKRRYHSMDELISDLRDDKVSLRDDVVEKLKKELI